MLSRIYVVPKTDGDKGNSYLIESKLSKKELEKLAQALTNPILEKYYINTSPEVENFFRLRGQAFAIEIGFLPGVTDNVGHTVKEIAEDLLHLKNNTDFNVYTSKIYFVSGSQEKTREFAQTLYNPLIERAHIAPVKNNKVNFPLQAPKVMLKKRKPVLEISLNVSDEELIKIGKEGILDPNGKRRGPLALDLESMRVIK